MAWNRHAIAQTQLRKHVASMACRATDDAATAATDGCGGSRRPKAHQFRRRDAGSPPTAPHHHTARPTTILRISPVPLGTRPRRGPNSLEIENKTTHDLV
jgi:hypothetical protein